MTQAPPNTPKETDCEAREWLYVGRFISQNGHISHLLDGPEIKPGGDKFWLIEKSAFEKLREERDAYAQAMALALREGIFADKQKVKNEIWELLKTYRGASNGK